MKNIFKSVIDRGGYDLPDMLKKIDQYHVKGQLSDQDKDELYRLARAGADPTVNLDLLRMILELMDTVKDLQSRMAILENGNTDGEEQPDEVLPPADYVAGKWYRNGDRCTFEGATYTCTAPEGMVCTWSPAEYPAYWEEN